MSWQSKYIPLTFINEESEIIKQITNTIVIGSIFSQSESTTTLSSYIMETQYGYNDSAKEGGLNKFLRISDISNSNVNWESVPFCNCNDTETYELKNNDIVIARTGGTTGKSYLISNPPKNSIFAGYLIRVRAKEKVLPDFLYLFLNSYVYWSQIVSLNTGEFRPSINAKKIEALKMPNFNTEQQNLIIKLCNGEHINGYEEIFLKINTVKSKLQRLNIFNREIELQKQYLAKLKQSILQDAICGKLTEDWREANPNIEPASELLKRIKVEKQQQIKEGKIRKEKPLDPITDTNLPFTIPPTWQWCRLGDLCIKTGSGSTPSGGKSAYPSEGIYFLRSQNVYNSGIVLDGVAFISDKTHQIMSGTKVKQRDLLLNITGGSIGRCAIVPKGFDEANINQHVAIIRLLDVDMGEFVHSVIISDYFQKMIVDAQTGAGREGLPKNKMDKILIPIPPQEEQKRIVEIIKNSIKKCSLIEAQITANEQTAQNLIKSILCETFNNN